MFQQTRLKLTAWYLLIIMFVSLSFSLVIHQALINEVDRFASTQNFRLERLHTNSPSFKVLDPELIQNTKDRVTFTLALVNGIILIASAILGYFLAGRTLKPIKRMVDEQNRFVSDSSHELRTPLTALKLSTEVALRDPHLTLKETKALLQDNLEEINRLQSLSNKLLQLSQAHQIHKPRQFKRLNLSDVLQQALKTVIPIAYKRSINIKYDSKDLYFYGDFQEIVDLLTILLDNAVKYSHDKGVVEVTSKKIRRSLRVQVIDHGIGIKRADLPNIFNRFYRSDQARQKQGAGGYGLGLSIAKKITDNYGGTLTVKSKLDKGSAFTLNLPTKYSSEK